MSVEKASRADERRILSTLAGLPEAAAGLAGPALLMLGEAMALARLDAQPADHQPIVRAAGSGGLE